MRIEPGLYEWVGFLENNFPELYTPDELKSFGYNIDTNYVPQLTIDELRNSLNETVPELYKRNHKAMESILTHSNDHNQNGNILIVVHAISLETCTRFLLRKNVRPWQVLKPFFAQVGLCSMVALRESENNKYEFVEPPAGPVTQSRNDRFNWTIFLED